MIRDAAPPRERDTLLTIFGIALAIRFVVFAALCRSAYLDQLELDMKSYHELALRIADGQLRPTQVFYQSPLYAYFLGGLYRLFGSGLWVPRIANALLGASSAGLAYVLGCHYFSRRAGWIAALALASCGPLLLEEYSVLKTALVVFLLLLALALLVLHQSTGRRRFIVAAGISFGLLCTAAGQFLIALPLLVLCVALQRAPGRLNLLSATLLFVGSLLPLTPVVAWNSSAGGGLLLTSADAGFNLYLGNNPHAREIA